MNLDSSWCRPVFQLARGADMVARAARGWDNANVTGGVINAGELAATGPQNVEPPSAGEPEVLFATDSRGLFA
jgi:hypothetical protein